MPDDQATRRGGGSHHAGASEFFGASQRGFDVRHAHVEDSVALVIRSASDTTPDARPVVRGDQIEESVAVRIGYLLRDGRWCVELPAEELTEVLAQPCRILRYDLEMHHRS